MRARRALLFFGSFVVAACGSTATRGLDDAGTRIDRGGGTEAMLLDNVSSEYTDTILASSDAVWNALVATYEELEFPVTRSDPGSGLLEALNFTTRRIDGERMSRYFNCGSSLTGAIADTYQVTLAVQSVVAEAGRAGSIVVTEVDANAESRESRTGVLHCESTGRLPDLILQKVQEHIGGGR